MKTEDQKKGLQKYDPDKGFREPVVKCYSCGRLIKASELYQVGQCPSCGNKRVRNLGTACTEDDIRKMYEWKVDRRFMALYFPDGVQVPKSLAAFNEWVQANNPNKEVNTDE